jgi:subtilisin family serine protease
MQYLTAHCLRIVTAAMLASLAAFVSAQGLDSARCLVSFDSARLDTCSGTVTALDPAIAELADPVRFANSRLRLVKFAAPIHGDQRAAVEATGARILGYAPHHAYVLESPPELDPALRGVRGVAWVGPFLPAFKFDPNLTRELGGAGMVGRAGLSRIQLGLVPGHAAGAALDALARAPGMQAAGAALVRDQVRLTARFTQGSLSAALAELATNETVLSIGLHWPALLQNAEGSWLHQSGVARERPLFDRGLFGCGEVIGVADTGVHASHCSFIDPEHAPQVSVCADGDLCPAQPSDHDHRKIAAYYKWSGGAGSSPVDGHGHGTHVAGSAIGNNFSALADCVTFATAGNAGDVDGMAPGARLVAQELGAGLQYLNDLEGNLYHAASIAYDNGARIHNNSWGSGCRSGSQCIEDCVVGYRVHSRDADAVVWDHPDLALFAAAGNAGSSCGPGANVVSPGNAKNVFSIGANLRGSQGENMWNGPPPASSRGPTADRRTKPDLVAQGSVVQSAARNTCGSVGFQGTSMAAPTAAGMAALVREYLRRGFYPSGIETPADAIAQPSAALIKAIMINGSHEIAGTGSGGPAPNTSQGWGQVRLEQALHFDGDARRLWLADMKTGLRTAHRHEHLLVIDAPDPGSPEPLTVTMVWHDYPALLHADPHGVNHLRLEVETPSGPIWTQKLSALGGLEDADPYADASTEDYDTRNTVHRLDFAAPEAGTYRVVVRGIQVAMGDTQTYALVASGPILSGETVAAPSPLLASIDPAQVVAETGSFTLTASGSDFSANATLRFDGLDLATTYLDENNLSGEVPGFLIEEPGTADITVFTPEPGGGTSAALQLEILPNPDRVFRNGFEG